MAQKYKLDSLNTFGYFILDISLLIITLCLKNSKYVYGNVDISVALSLGIERVKPEVTLDVIA